MILEGYSDDEMKATTRYMFTLGGGAVSWKSCKQTMLTRLTAKAELTTLEQLQSKQIGFVDS